MEARSGGGQVCRRLFRLVIKEQRSWMSGRTITPKCTFSSGSLGKSRTSRGGNGIWSRIGLSTEGADLVMVRRVESLGGLRAMGATNRPGDRASQHGARSVLPSTDEVKYSQRSLLDFLKPRNSVPVVFWNCRLPFV